MSVPGKGIHTVKGIREQFRKQGKYHTPPELVATLTAIAKSQLGDIEPRDVYDPTCGAGALLSTWGNIPKYGQDIDAEALADAEAALTNFTGAHGDTLTDPAFMDRRFHLIVANPPFSIKWDPRVDVRFDDAPVIPTKSKADYAFILHILHLLADDGIAVVMGFPGILYRGGREGKIRAWLIEQNLISHVARIPGGRFEDTAVETCVIVLKKNRTSTQIRFLDLEHDLSEVVDREAVLENEAALSVGRYVSPPTPAAAPVDERALQRQARKQAIARLESDVRIDAMVCQLAGTGDHDTYLDQLSQTISKHRKAS